MSQPKPSAYELAYWEVAARVHCKAHFGGVISRCWRRLRAADWAGHVRAAHVELVIVPGESCQATRLDLDGVVNVARRVCRATALYHRKVLSPGHLELNADRSGGDLLRAMVVEWDIAADGLVGVHVRDHRRGARPEDDRVRVGVTGRHAMGLEWRDLVSL